MQFFEFYFLGIKTMRRKCIYIFFHVLVSVIDLHTYNYVLDPCYTMHVFKVAVANQPDANEMQMKGKSYYLYYTFFYEKNVYQGPMKKLCNSFSKPVGLSGRNPVSKVSK